MWLISDSLVFTGSAIKVGRNWLILLAALIIRGGINLYANITFRDKDKGNYAHRQPNDYLHSEIDKILITSSNC